MMKRKLERFFSPFISLSEGVMGGIWVPTGIQDRTRLTQLGILWPIKTAGIDAILDKVSAAGFALETIPRS